MKKILFILSLALYTSAFAQSKYFTQEGKIGFEASVPSFEEVAAQNSSATAILNAENGEFASIAFVKGFRFKNALMEEHFNENYAESDNYPKAIFKGIFKDLDLSQLKEAPQAYKLKGELEFHGQKKQYEDIEVLLSLKGDRINITGEFLANVSDFKIKIPKIVSNKVKNDVIVSIDLELEKRN